METLDREDIQGVVAWGYGKLRAARYLLLTIEAPRAAAAWLASQTNTVTSAQTQPEESAVNIALTHTGLAKLGLGSEALAGFSAEFNEGMCSPHRSRILGDVEEDAPAYWRWGGPATAPVDILLMLFARDEAGLEERYRAAGASLAAGGLREVVRLDTSDLGFREHFGFTDGISQPIIRGLDRPGRPIDTVAPGEFLLGHQNEYGLYTERPVLSRAADPQRLLPADPSDSSQADFGRNGSYLVFRQLRQDVRRFWRFFDDASRQSDGTNDPAARVRLAAKMVGRWPSGAPLVQAPERDDPQPALPNEFDYFHADRYGFACPIGAHIRRTNPRDSLDPDPGSEGSLAINRRHRLLRRGREYGPALSLDEALRPPDPGADDPERGLHFICLNANLSRQFEFIQHTWANSPTFNGLYDDADPLVGQRGRYGSSFTLQGRPVRKRITGLPQFVSIRGGAYFFLPGIRALRYLGELRT